MPIRSSRHSSPAITSVMPSPMKVASRIPPGFSTRWSSSSHALQVSARCVNTDTAQIRSKLPSSMARGGTASLRKTCSGGDSSRWSQATLSASMSQPQTSADSASGRKCRSVRPAPHPKSSTRLPSNDQPAGSAATMSSCARRPRSS